MLAFARARTQPVPIELVARILPGIELAADRDRADRGRATGDRKQLLDGRRPSGGSRTTKEAADLEAIVLYAAWNAGATGARVIPSCAGSRARSMTAEGYALLATIGATIDDRERAAALKPIATFAKEYAKSVAADDKAMNATRRGGDRVAARRGRGSRAAASPCARRSSRAATIRARAAAATSTRSAAPTSRSPRRRRSPACRGTSSSPATS